MTDGYCRRTKRMTNSWCDQAEGGMNTVVGKKMVSTLSSLVDRLMTWQNAKLYGTVDEKKACSFFVGTNVTASTESFEGRSRGTASPPTWATPFTRRAPELPRADSQHWSQLGSRGWVQYLARPITNYICQMAFQVLVWNLGVGLKCILLPWGSHGATGPGMFKPAIWNLGVGLITLRDVQNTLKCHFVYCTHWRVSSRSQPNVFHLANLIN